VGLRGHLKPGHKCPAGARVRVDWSGPESKPETHPEDFISGCPAQHHDEVLTACAFEFIRIEDMGGLDRFAGRPAAMLPGRLVEAYAATLAARDRLLAERDHAQQRAWQR
jgi:hypothetical protein